jgi:hypothetical protein
LNKVEEQLLYPLLIALKLVMMQQLSYTVHTHHIAVQEWIFHHSLSNLYVHCPPNWNSLFPQYLAAQSDLPFQSHFFFTDTALSESTPPTS